MSLAVVKELFEEVTGRYDLAQATGYLNATWLINQGIRWLEKTYPLKNTKATYVVDIAADQWYVRLNHCQAVHRVWLTENTYEFRYPERMAWLDGVGLDNNLS